MDSRQNSICIPDSILEKLDCEMTSMEAGMLEMYLRGRQDGWLAGYHYALEREPARMILMTEEMEEVKNDLA
jgi:hypothetical protein